MSNNKPGALTNLLASVVEQSVAPIIITNIQGVIEYVNPAFTELTGYSSAEALGQTPTILKSGYHPPKFYQDIWESITAGQSWRGDIRNRKKNGELYWELQSIAPLEDNKGRITHFVAIKIEDTERRQADLALRQSEERYRRLFDSAPVGLFRSAPDGQLLDVNQSLIEMTGCRSREEMLSHNTADFYTDPEERRRWQEKLAHSDLAQGLDIQTRRRDGVPLWVSTNIRALRGDDAQVQYYEVSMMDITRRKAAEESLQESEARFRTVMESAPNAIVVVDEQGRIILLNKLAETKFGYTPAELLGRPIEILLPENQRAAHQKHRRQYIAHPRRRVMDAGLDLVGQRKDGSQFPVEISLNTLKTGQGLWVISIIRDVTERLRLEEQLRQSQKMDAIGRFTGGIAHDFNNILTSVNGFAELLQMRLPPDSPYRRMADNIFDSGQRAADLIRQLMALSRQQVVEAQVIDLNVIVTNMETMLRRIISEDIELNANLTPKLWSIKADPSQMEQIILNLAVNARDAMPGGGQLTIKTANLRLDEEAASRLPDIQPDDYVLLKVSDAGLGMSKALQKRIFEPFFTTKELGRGTGLGLSTVFGIVKQNRGHIRVYSKVGQGTSFEIYLPRVEDAVVSVNQVEQPAEMPGGQESILLVEDEAQVRNFAVALLRSLGYTVLEASDGQEALNLIEDRDPQIDLLLTDLVMPRLGGKALAEGLRQGRPQLKILFMSGYLQKDIAPRGASESATAFIQKPVLASSLASKVRQVLDAA